MLNKSTITTLFLDIGGVLLSNGWGHDLRRLAVEKFHLDLAEMEERHKIMFTTYEEGKITIDEYLNRVVFYKQRNFTSKEFQEFMFSLTTSDSDMITFIRTLKKQFGLKIVAVSNEARELNAHRINTFRLNEFIDIFISSCYVHVRKPDATIFKMALDIAQVSAAEVIYIDDIQMFADIATDLGIKSIRHIDRSSTFKALADMGLQIDNNKTAHA